MSAVNVSSAATELVSPSTAMVHPRLQAVIGAGRYHNTELDPAEFRGGAGDGPPPAAALAVWARDAGLWASAVRLRWRHLMRFRETGPIVLLLTDGNAAILSGSDTERDVVLLKTPDASVTDEPVAVDRMRLAAVWSGEALLLRGGRRQEEADAPLSLHWLLGVVLKQGRSLRDIGLASLIVSVLTIFPPLVVMAVVDKVLAHHSYSTLFLVGVMLAITVAYETCLGFMRRLMIVVVGTRIDLKLNLHIFNRLVRLPLDYFERHPAGEIMYKISQIHKVREFITGKLLMTFLDLITLCVLLPFLFWLNTTLAFIVVACGCLIALVIVAFLRPLRIVFTRLLAAETNKQATLGETIFGVKTIKALALEPQRRALWDSRVAEVGRCRLAFGKLANWPQTLVTPIERFMGMGCMFVGAYLALADSPGTSRAACLRS